MEEKIVARNEPCPCGSGKKYKRCHGVDAAPKLGVPKWAATAGTEEGAPGAEGAPGGMPFDPSKIDPAMAAQLRGALARMPRSQLAKLQSIVQRMASGKSGEDVARDAAELQRTLPPDLQQTFLAMAMQLSPQFSALQGEAASGAGASSASPMSEEEARKIIEKAAAEGKLGADKARELLGGTSPARDPSGEPKSSEPGGLWGSLRKKLSR
jgi:hypothetical protein